MRPMIRSLSRLAAVLALVLGASPADAADPCAQEARQDFRECRETCREAFQVDKDGCLNRDHACVEVCRAERAECSDQVGLDDAIGLCNQQLALARQVCRNLFPPDTAGRDGCVDQAQVVAFQCRDDAREAARLALRQCRVDFRVCARQCGPPDPLERVNVRQCRVDAKDAFVACQRTCVEDYQLAKDTCKNRDHECVEQCRAERHVCKAPIMDAFRDAVDLCRATRDTEVANCQSLYPPDSAELDTCIDNAQVVAFRCRDDARELARPQLEVCRQDYRGCVQICPPPAP